MPTTKKQPDPEPTPDEAHDAPEAEETPTDAPAAAEADDGADGSASGEAEDTTADTVAALGALHEGAAKVDAAAPRFCEVCGDPLVRLEQPQQGGFDPMTGEKRPDGVRVTVECAKLYHPRFYLSDGAWLPVT